ncbi:MAG: hypothetical protein AB7L92_02375 [Alphaproteobacteria bacterium]
MQVADNDTYERVIIFDGLPSERPMNCHPKVLAELLMQQWKQITRKELEATRYRKHNIAMLIEKKYGVDHHLTANYLTNLERTLPIFT